MRAWNRFVTKKLRDLEALIHEVSDGLNKEVPKGDSEALKEVLGLIHKAKSIEKSVVTMFAPLRDTVRACAGVFVCVSLCTRVRVCLLARVPTAVCVSIVHFAAKVRQGARG